MIKGIDKFKNHFKAYNNQYVVIGGFACDLLMNDVGIDFRATKDVDLVLIVEALSDNFIKAIWEFIKEGEYETGKRKNGECEYYRFINPKNDDYPSMIELFSRPQNNIKIDDGNHLIPLIPDDDDLSSLSAILLNDDYYKLLLNGSIKIHDISILDKEYLILFKIRAWVDLTNKKHNGEFVRTKDINKHKQDVFRLSRLLTGDEIIEVPASIKNDINVFINEMRNNDYELSSIGIKETKNNVLNMFNKIFIVNNNKK